MPRVALAVIVVALVLAGSRGARSSPEEDRSSRVRPASTAPAPPDVDLWQIRDIFRYADEAGVEGPLVSDSAGPSVEAPVGPGDAPSRTRLVGLVEKGGRRVAALSIDGEVVVLGEGDSFGGVTVTAIEDETVSLSGPEGDGETLLLP
jgi:hypothetical protein